MFILRLCENLDTAGVHYAIAGGYAVSLHGIVRGTIDIDLVLLLSEGNFIKCENVLQGMGLVSRIPVTAEDIIRRREDFISNKNLIAWNFYNPLNPSELVDILITHDLNDMDIKKIQTFKRDLKVVSIDGLILMKEQSGRPQDIEDVKALKELL